jgi:transposase
MFIRPCYRRKNGKRHAYWALVESYRTERGPRQRVVAYLGELDAAGRLGVRRAAEGKGPARQRDLFDEAAPEWVEVDASRVRVENSRAYGGPWLGLELARELGLDGFLRRLLPAGREEIPWSVMSLVLVLTRLCSPSSELHVAEQSYRQTALDELLGAPVDKVNEQRLYRALDRLLPHKAALEAFLKDRLGTLFNLEYDLVLYDVTSTYFEGEAKGNPLAQRGYSRDKRGDCKQVCIGLAVSRCGMPLGYQVFAGDRADVTTLREIVETMESRYGRTNRIWALDRGMVSEDNLVFLRAEGRRYIVGTPKAMLKRFDRELTARDWTTIRDGLEVKRCDSPEGGETFILCRSRDRREKEKAMHARFEERIEEGLSKLARRLRRARKRPGRSQVERQIGRLLGRNSRAAALFDVRVGEIEKDGAPGFLEVTWTRRETWRQWAELSEGCYLLRSNVNDWTAEELWQAYIQLTEAEAAFRIHKNDLSLRPVWHQRPERVQAHILVCFLAYVLWKMLSKRCARAGLGHEPRRVLDELSNISVVDVVLPTRKGIDIRKRCVTRPTEHQAILLQRLGLRLPSHGRMIKM